MEEDLVMLYLLKIIKNNDKSSIRFVDSYLTDTVPHYDIYRPHLTELLKLLNKSGLDFNIEKIFKKIRENINNG